MFGVVGWPVGVLWGDLWIARAFSAVETCRFPNHLTRADSSDKHFTCSMSYPALLKEMQAAVLLKAETSPPSSTGVRPPLSLDVCSINKWRKSNSDTEELCLLLLGKCLLRKMLDLQRRAWGFELWLESQMNGSSIWRDGIMAAVGNFLHVFHADGVMPSGTGFVSSWSFLWTAFFQCTSVPQVKWWWCYKD